MPARDCCIALVLAIVGSLPTTPADAVDHPFVFWNRDELLEIRQRIETRAWAREEWEREPENRAEASLHDLLDYHLFRNKEAGERQKQRLLEIIRSRVPLGGAQWVNVIIYDMTYDLLSDGERAEVERVFRRFIDHAIFRNSLFDPEVFNTSRNYQRYDARYYTRSNWLPNITWPRRVSANLMAAALADEELVREVWCHYGSWQWYFDEYLSDGGFYGEELSKMGATPGAMLVYCRAVRNLGLDELGFGYRSRSGNSMRGHIESLIRLGYPRVTLHSGRPHYPMLTTGDLRGSGSSRQGKNLPTFAFQHSIVRGYLPGPIDREIHRWQAHGAWGGELRGNNPQWDGYSDFTPKMMLPLWFEAGHAEWPAAGFDYFLSLMRKPAGKAYTPTLYFGLEPVLPGKAKAPRALSWVAEDRGLAMIRAEESPEYWQSAKPAVGLRLTADYAHHVRDSFSLSGFYALNRPIYLNRQTRRGYAFGYSRSILSHCGAMVDGNEPCFTDDVITRHGFYPPVKFLAASSRSLYDVVDVTRALMLTDRYLLDAFQLTGTGEAPHDFIWTVHALGQWTPEKPGGWKRISLDGPLSFFGEGYRSGAEAERDVTVIQKCALEDRSKASLPPQWYERKVGVKIGILGEEKTQLFVAPTPTDDPENKPLKDPDGYSQLAEVGGTSIIARRRAPRTCFLVFHVPFEGGKAPGFSAIVHPTGSEAVIAVQVVEGRVGAPQDWLLLDLRDEEARAEPRTVEVTGKAEFRFSGHGFVRILGNEVHAWGDIRDLRLEDCGSGVIFRHNGRLTRFTEEEGALLYNSSHQ